MIYNMRIAIQGFSYHFYVFCNICLCLDLYFMLKAPFQSQDKRFNIYMIASGFTGLLGSLLFTFDLKTFTVTAVVLLGIYIISAISTSIYSVRNIANSGLSNEVSKLIWSRHFYWISVFLISNLFSAYTCIIDILNMKSDFTTRLSYANKGIVFRITWELFIW